MLNKNLLILANLDEQLADHVQRLKGVDEQLVIQKEQYIQFEKSFNIIIYQELYTLFSGEMEDLDLELKHNAMLETDKQQKWALKQYNKICKKQIT